MAILTNHVLSVIFGVLGNVVSFGVFLSPIPTFYRIYKRKSSQGYEPIPYAVALFSAILLLYYGLLKTNGILIISINSFGCAIELAYLIIYMVYAPKEAKIYTTKLLLLFNLGVCGLVIILTSFLVKGSKKVTAVGWINVVTSICVFAAPLSIMREVIRTRSVEFMPISLSFFLTLNATMWFFYGFFIKDYYIAAPNILGFLLGLAQMVLYMAYKSTNKNQFNPNKQDKNMGSTSDASFHLVLDNRQIQMKTAWEAC
ncbi:Neuroendocrine convertase 1 [Dionaea muscipula]